MKFDVKVFKVDNKSSQFYLTQEVTNKKSSFVVVNNKRENWKENFIDLKIILTICGRIKELQKRKEKKTYFKVSYSTK